MSYFLNKVEPLSTGVKRIALEQTNKALASAHTEENVHEAIHDVRKRCKKLRALLRLVRKDTEDQFYSRWNNFYRDLAKQLSQLRDIHTNIETLGQLKTDSDRDFPKPLFDYLIEWLRNEEREMMEKLLENQNALSEITDQLYSSREEIYNWPVTESHSFGVMSKSLKKTYKRGYKAFPKAFADPKTEKFHEFRKRVKYLWYQTRLLKRTWPEIMIPRAEQTHDLAELLGDDHDLMVLKDILEKVPLKDHETRSMLGRSVAKKSQLLRQQVKPLASLIYAEKPKVFSTRIGNYWEIWQNNS